MATDWLSLLLREDHPLPPDAVLYFTQSLVNDSISIRKVCVYVYICMSFGSCEVSSTLYVPDKPGSDSRESEHFIVKLNYNENPDHYQSHYG